MAVRLSNVPLNEVLGRSILTLEVKKIIRKSRNHDYASATVKRKVVERGDNTRAFGMEVPSKDEKRKRKEARDCLWEIL
jgi:hypothetical protein